MTQTSLPGVFGVREALERYAPPHLLEQYDNERDISAKLIRELEEKVAELARVQQAIRDMRTRLAQVKIPECP